MSHQMRIRATAGALIAALLFVAPAAAQKRGHILRAGHFDSPASLSMLKESTLAVNNAASAASLRKPRFIVACLLCRLGDASVAIPYAAISRSSAARALAAPSPSPSRSSTLA